MALSRSPYARLGWFNVVTGRPGMGRIVPRLPTLVQPVVKGIQSQGVVANAKHYIQNNQEGLGQ